ILGENPGSESVFFLSFTRQLGSWVDEYCRGLFATTGWDPVTGMGTPNYTALRTAVGL
ncbi:hypothetical protein B0H14DRAFT_2848046, partial [Mycena olivaceomarginata]